jgi:hypothetical protein
MDRTAAAREQMENAAMARRMVRVDVGEVGAVAIRGGIIDEGQFGCRESCTDSSAVTNHLNLRGYRDGCNLGKLSNRCVQKIVDSDSGEG